MTDSNLLNRARGVLNLYRGASGGERQAARGALVRLLSTHGLTFRDLEPGLPPTRDPDDLEGWRPAHGWLAALGTDGQDDALLRLVDAEDLSVPERRQVLEALSVPALVASRAAGWLDADPELTEELLVQAGAALTPEDIVQDARPIAQAVQLRALQGAWLLARPERQIRAESEVHAEFLAGLLDGLGARRARIEVQGAQGAGEGAPRFVVLARLSAGELSRFRTAAAQHGPRLEGELRRAARQLGRELGGMGS
ncbi:hypothetical protein [Deinococcus aquiradiocola]|uniref:Uncharacterized protein n=1 Tax=Deinococcus aquiradiocola TaxID=393059 RepID=A0A917PIZ3_9DEIO|nr:hypothetical protein [Deinococcus aquiradiocola]GGJ80707.1 hypothetical protein GCM10008939_25700 [Deinococcus aquiradiocola]